MRSIMLRNGLTRRRLLRGAAHSGLALIASPAILRFAAAAESHGGEPFSLGVASGAPRPDGFVLWTRLAPEPLSTNPETPGGMNGGDVSVAYEIATDAGMNKIVRHGDAIAEKAFGYSVHLDVAGLEPGRPYWYRFMSGKATSRIGRAATLPAPNAALDRLRFGFVSCANYEHGYFSAYRHLADEHPDAVLFLGDYIYARGSRKTGRLCAGIPTASKPPRCRPTAIVMPSTGSIPTCSACTPKSRPLVTWDDHEVQNDYAD